MSEFIHLLDNGVYRLDHIDDIGTQWMKCSVCGETKSLNELERNRQEALARLKEIQNREKEILKEMSVEDLTRILDLTIKGDSPIKEIVFLIALSSYTDHDQLNCILGGESSIGKTYIVDEVLKLFPSQDIEQIEGASPKSLIHRANMLIDSVSFINENKIVPIDQIPKPKKEDYYSGEEYAKAYNEYKKRLANAWYYVDLERKILRFPDMPDTELLKTIRPLLSHDRKINRYEITEGKKSGGHKTKVVIIKGFPSVIYATANTFIDQQESTRSFLLTPTDTYQKIDEGLNLEVEKASNEALFWQNIEDNPDRKMIKERTFKIRDFKCQRIEIPNQIGEKLLNWFKEKNKIKSPKTFRDHIRVEQLVKMWALLNFANRQKQPDSNVIIANENDLKAAILLYEPILESQKLGLSPESYSIYKMVEQQLDFGLTIKDIHLIYYQNKQRPISDKRLRGILLNLREAGLVREEKDGRVLKYYAVKEKDEIQTRIEGDLNG